jgi:CDP-Glycerol:Poly(glycerophosphate) glycerophosphotransferase
MGFLSEYKQVTKVVQQKHSVVFYAESRHYFQYFEKLITDLLAYSDMDICYITSDARDPLLTIAPARIKPIYAKWMLGFLFTRIKADVMIMTMPDLDNFLFKRSKHVDTYIYMFHAAVSTHQQYRKRAFFNYDAIFCTGDYQEKEIRIAEKLYGKKEKMIIHYGYPLFDAIKKKAGERRMGQAVPTILIAPSWFEGCIFDTCLEELLQQLAAIPCKTILRSHPEYEKRKKQEFRKIQQLVARHPGMSMDDLPDVMERLTSTDILVTDRSGIAFEFAIGVGKPVLFIDTVLKKVNPDWRELDLEPIENSLRTQLGIAVLPSQLDQLAQKIKELEEGATAFRQKMNELEKDLFYNSPGSYTAGLEYVLSKIR